MTWRPSAPWARGVADRNGYVAQQMSDLYILDGDASDWLYGDQRIFAFTIEMYPTDHSHVGRLLSAG